MYNLCIALFVVSDFFFFRRLENWQASAPSTRILIPCNALCNNYAVVDNNALITIKASLMKIMSFRKDFLILLYSLSLLWWCFVVPSMSFYFVWWKRKRPIRHSTSCVTEFRSICSCRIYTYKKIYIYILKMGNCHWMRIQFYVSHLHAPTNREKMLFLMI